MRLETLVHGGFNYGSCVRKIAEEILFIMSGDPIAHYACSRGTANNQQ